VGFDLTTHCSVVRGKAIFFFLWKRNLPAYTLAGFDLTTHSSVAKRKSREIDAFFFFLCKKLLAQ
jgi:hypothetical protein